MGANRDIKQGLAIATALIPAVIRTATVTGPAIDLGADGGHEGAVIFVNVGAITDGTHTLSLTECDTSGGSYTAVAASDLTGTLGALVTSTNVKAGYIGTKRFLKLVSTVTGSPSTGGYYDAVAVLGRARSKPVA